MIPVSKVFNVSLVTSLLTIVLSNVYSKHVHALLMLVASPLLKVDLDHNGEPDIEQLKRKQVSVSGHMLPLGFILFNLVAIAVKVLFIIAVINYFDLI